MDEYRGREPGWRLVTQNLLISGAYLERGTEIDWGAIRDLSALINVYCLYDKMVVLGRGSTKGIGKLDSEILDLIQEDGLIQPAEIDEKSAAKVAKVASRHLRVFLDEEREDIFEPIARSALSADNAWYSLCAIPDGWDNIEAGRDWLKKYPSRKTLLEELERESHASRGTTFLVRSFLYLAYAIEKRLVLTPDSARALVLGEIAKKGTELRERVLLALQEGWKVRQSLLDDEEVENNTTPLAAVVFERAYPDRRRIVPEMRNLRDELAPFRNRLRPVEEKLLYGTGPKPTKAEEKWSGVIEEIGRAFGKEPYIVRTKAVLDLSTSAAKVIDEPKSYESLVSLLVKQPVEMLQRFLARRPAIELHDLIGSLPATEAVRLSAYRLFGVST